MSSSLSDMAFTATDDQSTHDVLDIRYLQGYTKEIKSEVENTVTLDWYLNAFSPDQIGQLKHNAERITLASTATSIHYHPHLCFRDSLNLLASDSFISSDSSSTSSLVNLLLDMILFNSRISSSSRFSVLLTTNCQFTFGNSFISSLNSSGISTLNSPISITANNIGNEYINTFTLTLISCEDAGCKKNKICPLQRSLIRGASPRRG